MRLRSSHPRRLFGAMALVGAAAIALSGCAAGSTPVSTASNLTPVSGGTLVYGGLATKALNPLVSTFSSQSRQWVLPVLSSLFWTNPDPATKGTKPYLPNFATEYQYSSDNLTLTITLRSGLKFSDGSAFDAAAVVWNFQQHITNKTREAQYFINTTTSAITAPDSTHVQVKFTAPNPLLLDAMATSSTGMIVSPTAYTKLGKDGIDKAPVGAGPFMISEVDPGNQIEMVRNPSYWDAEHVYLDGVTWISGGSNSSAQLANLQAGTINAVVWDGADLEPGPLQTVQKDPSLQLINGQAMKATIIPMNTFKAPFNDLRARQAIGYCMDRESLANNTLQGYAVPAYVLSGTPSYVIDTWQDGKALNPIQHDVAKGKALVQALGGLKFEIITPSDSAVVTALKQQWAECGIDATIKIDAAYLDQQKTGNFNMVITSFSQASQNPAASTNYLSQTSDNNKFGWRDAAIWSQIEAALPLVDPAQIKAAWLKIWPQLVQNGFITPIISVPPYLASSAKVHGLSLSQGWPSLAGVWMEQ